MRKLREMGRGDEVIDVRVPTRDLTEEEVDAYLVTSNYVDGSWDWDELANSFDQDMLQDIGFTGEQLGIETNIDDLFDENPDAEDEDDEDVEHDKIVLVYTRPEYEKVVAAFDAKKGSREDILWKLLGLGD